MSNQSGTQTASGLVVADGTYAAFIKDGRDGSTFQYALMLGADIPATLQRSAHPELLSFQRVG